MTAKTLEFKTELKQIMDIIIHYLYSHKEIFLRELLSNGADAIDKIRFEALTNHDLLEKDEDWKIQIIPDEKNKTLTIRDNGVGMNQETIVEDLGTIARSGTLEFLNKLKEADEKNRPELIGQFGVGFYASFMVAKEVTVISRTAGDPSKGVKWVSDGMGTFTIDGCEKETRGTDIILTLKEDEEQWLSSWKIKELVKRFSDFIEHPIILITPKKEQVKEGEKEVLKETGELVEETINSGKAIWLRPKGKIKEEDYNAFYNHITHDTHGPLKTIHYGAEGTVEFKALLYLPKEKPLDFFFQAQRKGLLLYVKRVQIMDNCEQLLPHYLDFVRGVVDSSDLPLNVSREMLQEDRLLKRISKNLVKKVLSTLKEMQDKEGDDYKKFYGDFGAILRSGVAQDYENQEKISELLLYQSLNTEDNGMITLDQYIEKMQEDQEEIFFMIGESRAMVENSPYMELFKEKGQDVLIMNDPVDEIVVQSLLNYKGKKLKAIDRGELNHKEEEKPEEKKEYNDLLSFLNDKLPSVKEVRLSTRLKESAACLVGLEGSVGVQMEKLMKEMGQESKQERILELNPDHPVVTALQKIHEKDPKDQRIVIYGELLYDQAALAAGVKIQDPAKMAKKINDLMMKDAGL